MASLALVVSIIVLITLFIGPLVYLLSRRFELVSSVWDLKKMVNMQTLQPNRWNEVLQKIKDYSEEYWVNPNFTHEVWELIHKEALSIENNK